jgi:hypothetical protein
LRREDSSDEVCIAISWHNTTINRLKAITIRGIDLITMDSGLAPPHEWQARRTLREKLHSSGGFITIVSTPEKGKLTGITTTPDEAKNYTNSILKDLCNEIYKDGTLPTATTPEKKPPKLTIKIVDKEERSLLFDTQCKSWAELTMHEMMKAMKYFVKLATN